MEQSAKTVKQLAKGFRISNDLDIQIQEFLTMKQKETGNKYTFQDFMVDLIEEKLNNKK